MGKSATDFGKISHRLPENEPPTMGKSAVDWENEPPTTGKSATDFGKMSHGLWENELRRHIEIRNKLFQEISLNKIT